MEEEEDCHSEMKHDTDTVNISNMDDDISSTDNECSDDDDDDSIGDNKGYGYKSDNSYKTSNFAESGDNDDKNDDDNTSTETSNDDDHIVDGSKPTLCNGCNHGDNSACSHGDNSACNHGDNSVCHTIEKHHSLQTFMVSGIFLRQVEIVSVGFHSVLRKGWSSSRPPPER